MVFTVLPYVAAAALAVLWINRRLFYRHRLPPGPPQSLLSGNVRDLPREQSWRTYESWAKIYGPILHLRIFSRHLIIINSAKAAVDLLDKRAIIYSSRPMTPMNSLVADRSNNPFYIAATKPRFQIYRKMFHRTLGPRSLRDHAPVQEHEAHLFLRNLLIDPANFDSHIRKNAAAVIMRITYGYNVRSSEPDPFVDAIENVVQVGAIFLKPGRWLADSFPALLLLPQWLPGGGFHREARKYGQILTDAYYAPFRLVKDQMNAGTALPSFTSLQLSSNDFQIPEAELDGAVLQAASALYVGAADTTLSALISFFYNMMVCPQVQRHAQKELDRVVGRDRLPSMDDRVSLPYLDRLIAELLRWCPPAPLALPHEVIQDDEYEGYNIPAGATVIANLWAIMHDPDTYRDPMKFDPDRFSSDDGQISQEDPRRWVWGFGRRVCPGQYLAEAALFINIACTLAVFNVSKPLDDEGMEVEPLLDFTTGTTTRVKPFKCDIRPRPECAGLVAHLEALNAGVVG